MIASFYDGRVRIRHRALKDPEFMATVQCMIGGQDGIIEMRANPKTGSLLVLYDPAVISREQLTLAAQVLANRAAEIPAGKKKTKGAAVACLKTPLRLSRRNETLLLTGVYGVTLLGGFINTRLHIAAGGLFTLLAAKHLYDRKRCL